MLQERQVASAVPARANSSSEARTTKIALRIHPPWYDPPCSVGQYGCTSRRINKQALYWNCRRLSVRPRRAAADNRRKAGGQIFFAVSITSSSLSESEQLTTFPLMRSVSLPSL